MNTRLAVWSSYYCSLTPENAVLELKKYGITASELSDEHGAVLLNRGEPKVIGEQFKAFLEKEEFIMTQGHLWLQAKLCDSEDVVYRLLDWVDLYDTIGVKNAVLHVSGLVDMPDLTFEDRVCRFVEKLKIVEDHIKKNRLDICICIENAGEWFRSIDTLNYLLDRLDDDCFGICLDTGHLNLSSDNNDQRNFILKAGKRLKALHIADNEGKADQHLMPFGKGRINFEEVVSALREIDYEGLFNLEIPGERNAPLPILGYKLEYIQKCYDYLMDLK